VEWASQLISPPPPMPCTLLLYSVGINLSEPGGSSSPLLGWVGGAPGNSSPHRVVIRIGIYPCVNLTQYMVGTRTTSRNSGYDGHCFDLMFGDPASRIRSGTVSPHPRSQVPESSLGRMAKRSFGSSADLADSETRPRLTPSLFKSIVGRPASVCDGVSHDQTMSQTARHRI